jgi:D-beta-D-heptose 7-phosphate kinase/D-beta-D-heptose 1-phosphate adenosyltransferase
MKTILINGCFDCFHEGHKYLIRTARKFSRKVIVLLNSDISVRKLKGINRPIDNQETRRDNIWKYWKELGYLNGCGQIQIHYFDTEEELKLLIDKFQPDMIIKGNDRPDVRDIIGSDKWPICILPRLKDTTGEEFSTTRIIKNETLHSR